MRRKHSLKYENPRLQADFLAQLRKMKVPHSVSADGAALFWKKYNDRVQSASQVIRDRQFRWYLVYWDFEEGTAEFRRLIEEAGMKFVVEIHDDETWFLLPRKDEPMHQELSDRAFDSALVLRAAVERQGVR